MEEEEVLERDEWIAEMEKGEWAVIGRNTRNTRLAFGLSIAEMARCIGISDSTLSRYERGKPVMAAQIITKAIEFYFRLNAINGLANNRSLNGNYILSERRGS